MLQRRRAGGGRDVRAGGGARAAGVGRDARAGGGVRAGRGGAYCRADAVQAECFVHHCVAHADDAAGIQKRKAVAGETQGVRYAATAFIAGAVCGCAPTPQRVRCRRPGVRAVALVVNTRCIIVQRSPYGRLFRCSNQ